MKLSRRGFFGGIAAVAGLAALPAIKPKRGLTYADVFRAKEILESPAVVAEHDEILRNFAKGEQSNRDRLILKALS